MVLSVKSAKFLRTVRTTSPLLATLALALLGTSPRTLAQPYTYTGGGSGTSANPINGFFSTGFTPPLTTGSSSTSLFFGGNSYTATDDLLNTVTLTSLSFSNTGAVTLVRGTNAGAANSLTFANTGFNSISFNNTGSLTIGLNLILNGSTTVAGSGSATLSGIISGAGNLIKNGSGTITLTGVGSSISSASFSGGTTLITGVDNASYASLNTASTLTIAANSGDVGVVTVSGTNGSGTTSSLKTSSTMTVGLGGNGTLNVTNGATATAGTLVVGGNTGSNGTVTVSGVGSSAVTASLIVGDSGTGTLNVTAGASLNNTGFSNSLLIGNHSGSNGVLNVSGVGSNGIASSFTNSGNLTIGILSSSGALNVTDGGSFINNGITTINGTLTASGINQNGIASSFRSSSISVGGKLYITNGATVTTGTSGTSVSSAGGTLIINGGSLTTNVLTAFDGAIVKLTNPLAGGYALTLTSPSSSQQFIYAPITDAAAGDGASGSIAGGPGGAGGIRQAGNSQLFFFGANTYSGATQIDSGSIVLGNSLSLQNSTAIINVNDGLLYEASLTTFTLGGLAGTGLFYSDIAFNVGNNNSSTTYSGVLEGSGTLNKVGTGTLTLTGAGIKTGATTISQGTIAARNTALGTGAVTVGSNGRLSVGSTINTGVTPQGVNTLTVSSLTLAAGAIQPQLTFNLGTSGVSDLLILTGTGTNVFSATDPILVGFSSASGTALGFGTYTLITFSGQTATTNLPSITQYQAVALGNLTGLETSANPFQYAVNGQGQQTLTFTLGGGAAVPEPSSLLLFLVAAPPGILARAKSRVRQDVLLPTNG